MSRDGVVIEVQPSARLEAQARDPKYTTTLEDLPRGLARYESYPRIGDQIEWPDGAEYTVEQFYWPILTAPDGTERPVPIAVVGHG